MSLHGKNVPNANRTSAPPYLVDHVSLNFRTNVRSRYKLDYTPVGHPSVCGSILWWFG